MLALFIIEYIYRRECYGHHLFSSAIIAASKEKAINVISEITEEELDVKSVWRYDDLGRFKRATYLSGSGPTDFGSFVQKRRKEEKRKEKEYDEKWWDFRVED